MKTTILIVIMSLVLLTMSAYAGELFDPPKMPGLSGFPTMENIGRDDSASPQPPITIPKSWKLISVSNGHKANSNNLWFQDKDGTIYMIDGFMTGGGFIINGVVHRLNVK